MCIGESWESDVVSVVDSELVITSVVKEEVQGAESV